MIKRTIQVKLKEQVNGAKLLVLKAPMYTEREALLLSELDHSNLVLLDLKDKKIAKSLSQLSGSNLLTLFGDKNILVLKEAQLFPKLQQLIEFHLADEKPRSLFCICSSNPTIDDALLEVLDQNGLFLSFYAPGFVELSKHFGLIEVEKTLAQRLVFGNYPPVLEYPDRAKEFLHNAVKEIIEYSFSKSARINKKEELFKVLRYISFNIGKHLSYNEIGSKCSLDNETVERYIEVLQQAHLLFKLPVFHSGQRYELSKTHRFFFLDNGIRNALIENFSPLDLRFDADVLWKNWLIAEKIKQKGATGFSFWLTHTNQEMDLIEGEVAYQLVWDKAAKVKVPKLFSSYYPGKNVLKITRSSYWNFLAKD